MRLPGVFEKVPYKSSHAETVQQPFREPVRQSLVWWTAEEAADYLKMKPSTVKQWARQGKLKGYPTPGTHRHRWRFLREDLDAMLTVPSVALNKGRIE